MKKKISVYAMPNGYNKQLCELQNIINEAYEYNEHLIKHAMYHLNVGHLKKMKKILQGKISEN